MMLLINQELVVNLDGQCQKPGQDGLRRKGRGEEVEAVNTDNPVVKFGCEEKEGNGTVPGGKMYVHLGVLFCRFSFFFSFLSFFFSGCPAQHVGSYFPYQKSNPCSLQWKYGFLTTGPPGKALVFSVLGVDREHVCLLKESI